MTGRLIVSGGGVAVVAAGIVHGNVISVVAVLAAIVFVSAAQGLGDASYIICRAKLLHRMGISDPQQPEDSDDEASTLA
jgi:hypothetical protein